MALLVQCCVAICGFVLVVQGEKRLLLSYPDVINDRLLQMDREIQKLTADTANKLASFTTELASHKQQITSKIAKLEQSSSGKFVCTMFLRYCPNTRGICYETLSSSCQSLRWCQDIFDWTQQNKNTTQYVLDTTMRKQIQII